MKTDIIDQYRERHSNFTKKADELRAQYNALSWMRVVLFVLAVIGAIIFADEKNGTAMAVTILVALGGYLALLKTHSKLRFKLKIARAKAQINLEEIARLEHNFNKFADGKQYYNLTHPYHEDLDIFGKHSLFQYLNRSSTTLGEKKLAQWLGHKADKQEITARQEAVKELSPQLDFRQDFQAYKHEEGDVDHVSLIEWLEEDSNTKPIGLYKGLLLVFPIAMVTTIILSAMGIVPTGIPVLIGFINTAILGSVFKAVSEVSNKTEVGYKALSTMRFQIGMIEQHNFNSNRLKELKRAVSNESSLASKTIAELQLILDNFQNRSNLLYVIFDILFLLDVYWFVRIIKWKKTNKADIAAWFEATSELDALNSLAGYAYSNTDLTYPEVSDDLFKIEATDLGHPLIPAKQRVSNNFEFNGQGGICLITGSNMSGKSTFLRTVGINCVLGLMGAPVCAKKMTLSILNVFTSMRSQDDLEENVSSFYAELKRLKQLLGSIDNDIPVLFMIDEVLKGTNSEDRHKGAIALIRQLNKAFAFGFVSTHDIELGNITNELEGVKNYSFNSEIVGDEIKFDYTLTPGICKSFNATKLMQKMGIEIPE